jgi:hypothetical protein
MNRIDPTEIRYIKLGPGGDWAEPCFERGEIQFGYRKVPHELCQRGDWEGVVQLLAEEGRKTGKARDALREIRDFYTLGPDCLWITVADGHLWWAFAQPGVTWLTPTKDGQAARSRTTVDGWRKASIKGVPLRVDSLSTRLTQVAAYRRTICSIGEADYLLRRINGIDEPVVVRANEVRKTMVATAAEMIAGLHWADFETLVDLIFVRSGWQRTSRVGGDQTDVDLILEQPTTGETAFVQVKSKAGQAVLDDYIGRFRRNGVHDRMFFVCHTPKGPLTADRGERLHIWVGDRLADAAVKAGLFDWLIERSA